MKNEWDEVQDKKQENTTIIKDVEPYIISLRRHFHQFPELSSQEFKTSLKIQEELKKLKIPFETFGTTGVIGYLGVKKANQKCVLLRADIDALPVTEHHEDPFCSQNLGVMHACGHDGHTAMLLGAAKILKNQEDEINGLVKLVFQPAEETGSITREPYFEKVLDGVNTAFAIHVDPSLNTGEYSIETGPRMAGVDDFEIIVTGSGGHGAMPHLGTDALLCGAHLVVNLQDIISREMDPLDPVVLTVGVFNAGVKANILAKEARLLGNIRFFKKELREQFPSLLQRYAQNTALTFHTSATVQYTPSLLPVINNKECCAIGLKAGEEIFQRLSTPRTMGMTSDDFSRYLEKVPGVYAFLGTGGEKIHQYPLHHEKFALDEHALILGARLHAKYAMEYLNQ